MKKILLCLFMALFILSSLCLCAFATDETSSVEYVHWFGESTIECLKLTSLNTEYSENMFPSSPGIVAPCDFVVVRGPGYPNETYTIHQGDTYYRTYSNGATSLCVNGTNVMYMQGMANQNNVRVMYVPLDYDTSLVTDAYIATSETVSVPSDEGGFVTDGFTSSLGIVGSVLGFILGSPLLALVGLSVGVFLLGWGITSVKDLIKGY